MKDKKIVLETPSKAAQQLINDIIQLTTESDVETPSEVIAIFVYCITSFSLEAPNDQMRYNLLNQASQTIDLSLQDCLKKSKLH